MPHSDDFGGFDDDTEFLAAATQVEATQNGNFHSSPRPTKRRRLGILHNDIHAGDSLQHESSETLAGDQELSCANSAAPNTTQQPQRSLDDGPDDDAEYYFPGELAEQDEQAKRSAKYKIHVPAVGGQFRDQIFTQTQHGLDESPSRFRGAVWKRPLQPPPPPPAFGANRVHGNGLLKTGGVVTHAPRQTTLTGITVQSKVSAVKQTYQDDAELAARVQAEEDQRSNVHPHVNEMEPQTNGHSGLCIPDDLADLPSDAFSSSPESNEVILISSQVNASQAQVRGLRGPQQGLKQMTIFGQPASQALSASQAASKKHAWPLKSRDEPPTHHKLDEKAMETWVYPTNLGTIRDYQYNIVTRSLFHNTLVALPTGLGKTFIAATVMYNYYRWTKDAQIVFMAPTKPLIAQQMEACYGIVGIPRRDTVLMTGETSPALRAEEWLEKRVFFMTPQTVINDLKTGICDPKKIVLVVVDEAHKATGGYAYTEVVNFLRRFNTSFRVQALTATPGSNEDAVQAVIDHLGIARVELRTEQSLDIREYTHEKHTETELFDFSDEQTRIMDFMSKAIRPVQEKLCTQNAYWSRDPMALTAYGLTIARQKWMNSDAGKKAPFPIKGMLNAIFTVLASLAHSLVLLKFHGIAPFYACCVELQKSVDAGQNGKYAAQIVQSEDFVKMMSTTRTWTSNVDFIGHPKLEYLREVVLNHFLDAGEGAQGSDVPPSATRVMVFSSFRDSTEEICRVLKRSEPMIRPHVFVGQASSKSSEGMDQKRQSAVIQDFKSGKYNTLVATSIGEEGLDIGTVDLIVCYDASSSPIRMLQRIGRTGRKRVGKVVLLLMRGKEEGDYAKAQDNYTFIQKTIADPSRYIYRDEQSPRILPRNVQPVVDKRVIDIPVENSQPIDLNEKGRKAKGKSKAKRPPKKFHMPDGVRTGFVKASKMDSDADESEDDIRKKRKAATQTKAFRKPSISVEPEPEPEPDPIQLPFLEDVLLTSAQQNELNRKYARTADDEADQVIRPPDVARFPIADEDQRLTKYIRHGRSFAAVAKAMGAIRNIHQAQVDRMKALANTTDLLEADSADYRLASPSRGLSNGADDLPIISIPGAKSKNISESKPKPKPRKQQALARTASIRSVETTETRAAEPTPRAKKQPRGRPRKDKPITRTTSYGSAAAEGDDSSPEPTPANMRIGTQGIDLGSKDTSGEEEDELPDSELADFVVRSDQPIEMASSSQQLPDDTQPPMPTEVRRNRLKSAAELQRNIADESDDGSSECDSDIGGLESEGDNRSVVEEVSVSAPVVQQIRKKRVVEDSDDDA